MQGLNGKFKAVLVKRENEQNYVQNEKEDECPELFPDHEDGKFLNSIFNSIMSKRVYSFIKIVAVHRIRYYN